MNRIGLNQTILTNTIPQVSSPTFKGKKNKTVDKTLKDWGYKEGISKTKMIGIGALLAGSLAAIGLHSADATKLPLKNILGPVKEIVDKVLNPVISFIKSHLSKTGATPPA